MLPDDFVPVIPPETRKRRHAGQVYIVSGEASFTLSESAQVLWNLIDSRRNLLQIAAELCSVYDIDRGAAVEDTKEFVEPLLDCGILSRVLKR